MAARIRSEHVVRMLTADAFAGRAYLVMEYLDGVTLAELLRRQGPLPLATAVNMLLQACEAISEAHTLGFFHHDLKPASLFLTHRADGSPCVKVLDFGISTVPRIATIAPGSGSRPPPPPAPTGTPQYMSPEQLTAAKVVNQSSDIWSLGAILYELVSGRRAFEGSGVSEIRTHVLHATPVPLGRLRPEIPKELERVVSRCFEKDPLRRHANVAQMAGALAPYGSSAARASAGSNRARRRGGDRRALAAVGRRRARHVNGGGDARSGSGPTAEGTGALDRRAGRVERRRRGPRAQGEGGPASPRVAERAQPRQPLACVPAGPARGARVTTLLRVRRDCAHPPSPCRARRRPAGATRQSIRPARPSAPRLPR